MLASESPESAAVYLPHLDLPLNQNIYAFDIYGGCLGSFDEKDFPSAQNLNIYINQVLKGLFLDSKLYPLF